MIQIRRVFTHVEEIQHEFGPLAPVPLLRGAIGAVLTNPYAGRYEPDILPLMAALNPVGLDLARRLLAALAVPPEAVQGYGKGAIVGAAGEIEHGALWHVPGGYAMRELLPASAAIVPSTKKLGGPGTRLDVPITHSNASYVRSHFDAMEVRVPDAPRRDEIVVAVVVTDSGRPLPRVGGLGVDEIRGEDGLR